VSEKVRSSFLETIKTLSAEPDIAKDDKENLRNLQYLDMRHQLWKMNETNISLADLNLKGSTRTYRALTAAEALQYESLWDQKDYMGLFQMGSQLSE
jgi:hypothetical protein